MPQTTEVEQFLRSIGPFYEEVADKETENKQPTPVAMETPAETSSDKQANEDVPPSEEGAPKSTNQIADEAEESGTESNSSAEDFKDSFSGAGGEWCLVKGRHIEWLA